MISVTHQDVSQEAAHEYDKVYGDEDHFVGVDGHGLLVHLVLGRVDAQVVEAAAAVALSRPLFFDNLHGRRQIGRRHDASLLQKQSGLALIASKSPSRSPLKKKF